MNAVAEKPMYKRSLSESIADEIQSRIQRGAWVGTLPGIRALANEFSVSPVTIDLAFKILERDAWIAPATHGKRRQILSDKASHNEHPTSIAGRKIGFLTSRESLNRCPTNERKIIERLRDSFELNGARLNPHFDPKAFSLKRVRTHLKKILDLQPMDFWIVTSPSDALAEALSKLEVPCLYIGIVQPAFTKVVASAVPGNLSELVDALIELGHKRIILPVPEIWHRHSEHSSWIELEFQRQLHENGLKASGFNTPRFGASPESLTACLKKSFAHTPPTAIITSCLPEYLTCASFLQSKGIQVPTDVSLATLGWQPEAEWITPNPACFKQANESLALRIARQVETQICGGNPTAEASLIQERAEFCPGESIAPPTGHRGAP